MDRVLADQAKVKGQIERNQIKLHQVNDKAKFIRGI